jgi:uncharacterized Ntn-hydrolase superfamily protein
MTFSIIGYCEETHSYGMAITSSSLCVAARCAWVRSSVGVVATQNLTNPLLGPLGLDLLARGLREDVVLEMMLASDPGKDYRQILLLGPAGNCVHYTGSRALPIHAYELGVQCGAAGNLLRNDEIPRSMVERFCGSRKAPLAARLLAALHTGLEAGGEVRDLQSAGLLVADENGWPTVNLRVDQHERPLTELQRLWDMYAPLCAGYVSRVSDPQLYQAPAR